MAYSIVRNLAYPSRLNLLSVYLVFLTTIPAIFTQTYHERIGVAGLNYIQVVSLLADPLQFDPFETGIIYLKIYML